MLSVFDQTRQEKSMLFIFTQNVKHGSWFTGLALFVLGARLLTEE